MKSLFYASLISILFLTGCVEKQDTNNTTINKSQGITNKNDFISELALHDAVRAKDFKVVKELVSNGSSIDSKDKYGYTPLHLAARLNQYDIAEYLIKNKASVNTVDMYKDTPLLDSTRNSTNAMSKLLLCNGAKKDVVDRHSMSPLHNSSKNNDLFIVKMIEASDITKMCQPLDITLEYYSESENKICGNILVGKATDVDLTISDELSENMEPFGKYSSEVMDNKYCAKLDKKLDNNGKYIITAVGTNSVDKDIEISSLADLSSVKKINEVKDTNIYISGLYEDLMKEFAADFAPWNAELEKNGLVFRFKKPEILFAHGSSTLTSEYKEILDNFFPRYLKVLNKYKDQIEQVRVEGHTSSVYSEAKNDTQKYEKNKELSTNRATTVYNYVTSISNDLIVNDKEWLNDNVQPVGMSYDDLIYDKNGVENQVLSRRVEFRINKKIDR